MGRETLAPWTATARAAMRYTEARLSKLSMEMVRDIEKETVDFYPNFDETLMQPAVMPAALSEPAGQRFVGHCGRHGDQHSAAQSGEVIDGRDLHVGQPGLHRGRPDAAHQGAGFPVGGVILGRRGIYDAYHEGRGRIIVRAKSEIEEMPGNRHRIVVTEIPYMVNKAKLIEKIAEIGA